MKAMNNEGMKCEFVGIPEKALVGEIICLFLWLFDLYFI